MQMLERTLTELVQYSAETVNAVDWREADFTPETVNAIETYEEALEKSLEKRLIELGRLDEDLLDELMDPEEGAASYNVLMTLRGEGVGIWDGRWDSWFNSQELQQLEQGLKEDLSTFTNLGGSGSVNEALMNAAFATCFHYKED